MVDEPCDWSRRVPGPTILATLRPLARLMSLVAHRSISSGTMSWAQPLAAVAHQIIPVTTGWELIPCSLISARCPAAAPTRSMALIQPWAVGSGIPLVTTFLAIRRWAADGATPPTAITQPLVVVTTTLPTLVTLAAMGHQAEAPSAAELGTKPPMPMPL